MDELRVGGGQGGQVEAFQQGQLLQRHRRLAPGPGLAERVAVIVVAQNSVI
jgi:hypothetical protein